MTQPLLAANLNEVQPQAPPSSVGNLLASYTPGGVLNAQFSATGVGNGADATDDTLFSYSLPANVLTANARALRIRAFGTRASGGGNNVIKVFFGATAVAATASTASATDNWEVEAIVTRTALSTQLAMGRTLLNATAKLTKSTPGETETAAITIKVTGSDDGSTANKVLGMGFLVEALP